MKRVLVIALALAFPTAASALQIEMFFPGSATEVTLAPSQTVEVEVYAKLNTGFGAGDTLITVGTEFEAAVGLDIIGTAAAYPGWTPGATLLGQMLGDGLGASSPYVSFGGPVIAAPAYVLLGTFTIHQRGEVEYINQDYELMFTDMKVPPNFGAYDGTGAAIAYHGTYGTAYSGYYNFGKGSPYIAQQKSTPGQAKDPLIVHCIPEPASLSLLVLGGLAALRRRK